VTSEGIDRRAVAMAVGEPMADQVLDGDAQLHPVPVPGIDGTVAWRVRGDAGPHPWQVYVGAWPDGSVRVLTADQDAWDELVAAAGARLDGPDEARAFVETYLEATRGAMTIVRVVDSTGDLRWRPGSDEEEESKAALLADPPEMGVTVEPAHDGFHVELSLVVDQRLQRNSFDVARSGAITHTSFQVLAEGLPLPVAR
jgi:hypothetical protein